MPLEKLDIRNTNIDGGLEYLSDGLVSRMTMPVISQRIQGKYDEQIVKQEVLKIFNCSVGLEYQAAGMVKVIHILNELHKFGYNIKAWQLAHPEEMYKAKPNLFADPNSKDEWIGALDKLIEQDKEKLSELNGKMTNILSDGKKAGRYSIEYSELESQKNKILTLYTERLAIRLELEKENSKKITQELNNEKEAALKEIRKKDQEIKELKAKLTQTQLEAKVVI